MVTKWLDRIFQTETHSGSRGRFDRATIARLRAESLRKSKTAKPRHAATKAPRGEYAWRPVKPPTIGSRFCTTSTDQARAVCCSTQDYNLVCASLTLVAELAW